MWSSRKALVANAMGLLLVILLLRLDFQEHLLEDSNAASKEKDMLEQPFTDSIKSAAETVEYLYAMQKGLAEVANVVESEGKVIEESCFFRGDPKAEEFSGGRWTRNGKWLVFSAYLDHRNNSLFTAVSSVQVLAMKFGGLESDDQANFCHLYFHTSEKHSKRKKTVVRAHTRMVWQRAWDPRNSFYNTFLITCPIPSKYLSLFSIKVAISFSKCGKESLNLVLVEAPDQLQKKFLHDDPPKTSSRPLVGVCIKGLDFMDEKELSVRRLAEWIELNFVMGAASITFYNYYVPPRLKRLLQLYVAQGKVELIALELPGESPNQNLIRHEYTWRNRQQKRRHELLAYNDCFYRYATARFDFVLIVDTDEVVVPLKHSTWQEMLTSVLPTFRSEPSAISIRNVFKFWKAHETGSLFDHPTRSMTIQDKEQYGKSFVK